MGQLQRVMSDTITVVRTVRVEVNIDDYVMAYGPGDDIEADIEADVERWLGDLSELAPIDIEVNATVF